MYSAGSNVQLAPVSDDLVSIKEARNIFAQFSQATSDDEIVFHGWLHLKTRSMMNVRPRHFRYCVLYRENHRLLTYRFQPSAKELHNNSVVPLRTYQVKTVREWNMRKFSLLVTVMKGQESIERVLEISAPNQYLFNKWRNSLSEPLKIDELGPNTSPEGGNDTPPKPLHAVKREANFFVKGSSIHRGLLNNTGENSCFLNVIIQSFWHLQPMRHFLLSVEIKNDVNSVETNVLQALQTIMKEYDDTSSGTLHSRALRKGLSVLYKADKNFQEGMMYDAEETLLALLNLMHQQSSATQLFKTQKSKAVARSLARFVENEAYKETPKNVFDEHSIPHVVFSHQIYDRFVCDTCQHTTPWDLFSNLVFTTYASDFYCKSFTSMVDLLRQISSSETITACNMNHCPGLKKKERTVRRFPMVFAISVLWSTDCASSSQLNRFMSNVSERVDFAAAFSAGGPATNLRRGGSRTTYRLRGLVCYYGKHYIAVFYSTAHKVWLLFDDSRVLELGTWDQVVNHCSKGRSQPVLLFYELPDHRKDSSTNISDGLAEITISKTCSINSLSSVQELQETYDYTSVESYTNDIPTIPDVSTDLKIVSSQNEHSTIILNSPECDQEELLSMKLHAGQNITPVAPSIAMQPRTVAMTSPLQTDQYDVHYADDCKVLGFTIQKFEGELCITAFPRDLHGGQLSAEKCGKIEMFDTLVQANGHPLHHYNVERVLLMIRAQRRPLVIRFSRSKKLKSLCDMGISKELATRALLQCRGNLQEAVHFCLNNH